jgi:hypothetical protein
MTNIRIIFYDQGYSWKGSCVTQEEFADQIIEGMQGFFWEKYTIRSKRLIASGEVA